MTRTPSSRPKTFGREVAKLWKRLRGGRLSPHRAALSIAAGFFVGALPFYGVQLLLVLAICVPFRLDAPVAYIAAHFSNPITLPLILAIEIDIGSLLLTGRHASFSSEALEQLGLGGFALQLAVGAPVLGLALAAIGGGLTLVVARRRKLPEVDPLVMAEERTMRRYAKARATARYYVRGKLDADPILRLLSNLPGSFGRLTDAGCGYGHVGLCLRELGKAEALFGFDPDPAAIRAAAAAAGEDAKFVVASFETSENWPAADTILFIDSLHYVNAATQDLVLEKAAASLSPGGRIVLREVNRSGRFRSRRTEWLERVTLFFGIRRASEMQFRPPAELLEALQNQGLTCHLVDNEEVDPFDNVVIIAQKNGEKPHAHETANETGRRPVAKE